MTIDQVGILRGVVRNEDTLMMLIVATMAKHYVGLAALLELIRAEPSFHGPIVKGSLVNGCIPILVISSQQTFC